MCHCLENVRGKFVQGRDLCVMAERQLKFRAVRLKFRQSRASAHTVRSYFWQVFNDDGFVELDEESMRETFELYEPGKPGVLWYSPPVVYAEDLFSAQVQEVKDKMHDTDFELDRDWPNISFREITASLLIGGGVLFDDADRSRNPYKRSLADQVEIGKYIGDLVGQWLHIRAFIELEDLTMHVDEL